MVLRNLLLSATCAFAPLVTAAPAQAGPYGYTLADVVAADHAFQGALVDSTSCAGQSCVIADLAGSTGRKLKERPEGGGTRDFKCIAKFNPKGVEVAQNLPAVQKQSTGVSSTLLGGMNNIQGLFPGTTVTGKFTGSCKPNILIFAKGTTEVGSLGITVGPMLNLGLGYSWSVNGVSYDADVPGDYCLGLPGGQVAKDMINQAAQKCPNSKLFVSGYSQGAMVAHNGVAYADPEAKKKVAGVVTFGDPFQGAPIKGYKGPIVTFCNTGDGVCTGNFEIGTAHLAYVGGPSTKAIAELNKMAAAPLWSVGMESESSSESSSEEAPKPKAKKKKKAAPKPAPVEEEAAPEPEPEPAPTKKTTKKKATPKTAPTAHDMAGMEGMRVPAELAQAPEFEVEEYVAGEVPSSLV